jgi:hypothetical protein
MPKTAVGLFKTSKAADEAVRDIEAIGFPRNEVRTLDEPVDFGLKGVTSIARIDFEVELFRELARIGAGKQEIEAYIDGLRHGGVLVFATGSDDKVDSAAAIMNRHGAVATEETRGAEPHLPDEPERAAPAREGPVQTGRIRQPGGGALFVW